MFIYAYSVSCSNTFDNNSISNRIKLGGCDINNKTLMNVKCDPKPLLN